MHRGVRLPVVAVLGALVGAYAAPARAQDESALKSSFEGKRLTVTIDMPGTSDGIDLQIDSARPLDYQRYGDRLKTYGISIRAGDSAVVTLVKLKKDLIEFQLSGGGFGTFGDDTSTSVYIPLLDKSSREKALEKAVREEDNPRRRRQLERELDELRERREVENRRLQAVRADAEEHRRERVAEQRLRGGSRFNLRYDEVVPRGITPREVMAALSSYVDFSALPSDERPSDDGAPRKGMTRADAERALGSPIASSERQEGGLKIVTLVFARRNERITADFVEDVLVRYVTTSR